MKSPSGDLLSLQTITWINKVICRCDTTQDTEHQATLASLLMSQSSLRSRLDQLLLCSTLNWMSSSLFITLLTVQRYILSLWNNLVCWLCQTVHWHVQHSSFLISINVLWHSDRSSSWEFITVCDADMKSPCDCSSSTAAQDERISPDTLLPHWPAAIFNNNSTACG